MLGRACAGQRWVDAYICGEWIGFLKVIGSCMSCSSFVSGRCYACVDGGKFEAAAVRSRAHRHPTVAWRLHVRGWGYA